MERDTSYGRSVVGTSRQRSRAASTPALRVVHATDTVALVALRLYSRIAVGLHGVVAMRSPQNIHHFVNNFQTVSVVYKEVLSRL